MDSALSYPRNPMRHGPVHLPALGPPTLVGPVAIGLMPRLLENTAAARGPNRGRARQSIGRHMINSVCVDFFDARDPIGQDPLDSGFQRHGRQRTAAAGAHHLQVDRSPLDP